MARAVHSTSMATELSEQPVPDVPIFCPECGGEPVRSADEIQVQHRLSAMGYLHDDQDPECSECGHSWTHGVPVGQFEGGEDLLCDSCQHDPSLKRPVYYRVHRVEWQQGDRVLLHLKCPRCYLFTTVERERDNRGVALVGYPDITGSTDGADEYGWTGQPPTQEDTE